MKRWISVSAGIGILASLALSAQAPSGTPFRIEKLDPALDEVIAPDAQLETLGEHFALTEGPVWIPRQNGQPGYLLFSDNAANVIYKWAANTPLSVFLENSGFTGRRQFQRRRSDHRGARRDSADRIERTCAGSRRKTRCYGDDRPYRLSPREGWNADDPCRSIEGKRFNGPNDIVVKSDGAVYFTDTVWGLRGAAQSPQRELPFSGFFLIKDGKVTLLGGDRDTPGASPNGITLSPDEKYLYVTAGTRRTMRYDILPDDHGRQREGVC